MQRCWWTRNAVEDIETKMELIATDEMLRMNLIEKGRIQRQKFSWQQTADRLWDWMMKALQQQEE